MTISRATVTSSGSKAYAELSAWDNLMQAYHQAACGKRGREEVACFEFRLSDELLALQAELRDHSYCPGGYRSFHIHEPKRRLISAAPLRDRVVHHALCNIIEPRFEARFIPDSYANRIGKGTHRAVDRLQQFSRRYRYVLRLDVVQHFPSLDHAILLDTLGRVIPEPDLMLLVRRIVAGGEGVLDAEYRMQWFPGDDLLAAARPRGLPIGNLTSQFWSNCYLNPFDHFIKRGLGCRAYLRYVDDMALFSDSKRQLWAWKAAAEERLAGLRLRFHPQAEVRPVSSGIPWLGFVVFPTHRRIKARNVRAFERRLRGGWREFCAGRISFAEFDATVQGWVAHACHGDTWGLRRELLGRPLCREGG